MKPTALDLTQALGHEASDKRIDILRRIGQAGSISEAARGAGVSYKAAWQALETLSNLAGQELVEKNVGGSGGGGAQLTAAGQGLLRAADELARARAAVLARLGREAEGLGATARLGLGLRTSMRNQLPCTVQSLERSGAAMTVQLALPEGGLLRSRITVESAELLALRPGVAVLALCKATAVTITAQCRARAGMNRLPGIVTRAAGTAADKEVSLRLSSGAQLVGFTRTGQALRTGSAAVAAVEESAVAIAVAE